MAGISRIALMEDKSNFYNDLALKIKSKFKDCFYNPETDWLAGWRSADGELHDYAFTFINYMAICLGLIEGETAQNIIKMNNY
jgi:hypothetical protein